MRCKQTLPIDSSLVAMTSTQILPQPPPLVTTRLADPTSPHALRSVRFAVSSRVFVVCWWSVLLMHLVSGVFLAFVGAVHLLVSTTAIYRAVWLLRVSQSTLVLAGWSYIALATPHFAAIARDVWCSINCRRLTFAHSAKPQLVQTEPMIPRSTWSRLKQTASVPLAKWRQLSLAAGVNGKHFPIVICSRITIEIVAQTYQAYLWSRSVPHVLLNRVLVCLVLATCLYVPILDVLFRHKPGAHLSAVLCVDLMLDIAVSVVLPLVLIVPHVLEFDWNTYSYPDELRYDEVWFVQTLSEVRQGMVTSTLDYMTTLVPYIAAIDSLGTLKIVLMRVIAAPTVALEPTKPSVGIAVGSTPHKPRFLRLFDWFAMLVALAVLAVHLHAEFRASNTVSSTCQLPMKPWFAHNMSCAVFDLNCHRQGIVGSHDQVATLLDALDRSTVQKVLFNHCAALSVPSLIQEFPHLLGIQTVNCTIAQWPHSAAVTQAHHAKMAEVQLFATNMTEFPLGLLHGDLPTRLSLIVHLSNLSRLPEDAGDVWAGHTWPYLSLLHVPLKRLPSSFSKSSVYYLTLIDNDLEEFQSDLFTNFTLRTLRLSQNRFLSELPSNLGSVTLFRELIAEHTNVSHLTPWLENWWEAKHAAGTKTNVVSLYGSPACADGGVLPPELCIPTGYDQVDDTRYEIVKKLRPL